MLSPLTVKTVALAAVAVGVPLALLHLRATPGARAASHEADELLEHFHGYDSRIAGRVRELGDARTALPSSRRWSSSAPPA